MDYDGSNVTHLIDGSPGSVQFTPDYLKIIINRGANGIWSMNTDGSEYKALIDTLRVGSSLPSISIDGKKIAFAACLQREVTTDIYIMNIDGSNPINLTKTPYITESYPSFSRDYSLIVYTTIFDSIRTISIMNNNGDNKKEVIVNNDNIRFIYPRFDINSEKIYYKFLGEQNGLYSVNINDSITNTILFEGHLESHFLSMPDDGSKIVFSCNSHIYIMSTEDYLIMDLGYGGTPMISNDGSKIVFNGVKIMNSDGSDLTRLEHGWNPRFSNNKDNYKIVYIGERKITKKLNKGIIF